MKHFYQFFILISVGFMCYLLGRCTHEETSAVKVVTVRDTIPGRIPPPEIKFIPVPALVDTAAILREHFAERAYRDTIIQYPELMVQVNDVVSRNQLLDRNVIIDYHRPRPPKTKALVLDGYATEGSLPILVGVRRDNLTYKCGYDVLNKAFVIGLSIDLYKW